MKSAILFIFFFIFGCFSQGIPHLKFGNQESKALEIGKRHVKLFLDSIESKNEKMIGILFKSTETDQMHIPTLIDMLQGFDISVESAYFNNKGEINANLRVDGIVPGVIILTKTPNSPTGYQISALGFQKPEGKSGLLFSMCYIGLFWCAIEIVATWAIGY
ncbi:hypothetical protein L5515_009401 [Caenorhabditis briggsae]|uniref:Lipoprotein n=2 Tax=Caenorhabditis briggsae TaxID=6238 RepID=A0AAE9F9T7_CAEBR|nr:hypothetical protein L5515_009396 [Caenorhabditis briggsae]UMM37727.1 hypothetical protein L5515_009401 [Caenorhabditis briggsae]